MKFKKVKEGDVLMSPEGNLVAVENKMFMEIDLWISDSPGTKTFFDDEYENVFQGWKKIGKL